MIRDIDYSVDVLRAVLWQYDSAPNLVALLTAKNAWYDQNHRQFWLDWYADVFDLRTANDFGLAVWAIILDIPLELPKAEELGTKRVFGFGPNNINFNNSNFRPASGITLTTKQRRQVLQLRYFKLYTRGAVPELNEFLAGLFAEEGGAYVVDNLDMTATYHFNFTLSQDLKLLLNKFDLLPRPSGVSVTYTDI
jgi:hypothetical protein